MIVLRVLDPRRWRARLLQLGGTFGAVSWIVLRATGRAPAARAVREARRARRSERIRARNATLEQHRLRP